MKITNLVCAVLALAGAHTASAQALTPIDSIVAVVENDIILRSELDQAVNSLRQQMAAQQQQLPPLDVVERQMLERLVLVRLQLQRAAESGIRVSDAEVDEAMQRVAEQNGITMEQMREAITRDGFSWLEFRNDMREEIITQRLRTRVANSRVEVSDTEIDIFLASRELDQGEVDLSHILIAVPQAANPEQVAEARSRADEVYDQLLSGADFRTTAIQVSDGQRALEGGNLGWRPADQVPTIFVEQIRGMQAGEITRPVRSPSGFHILKVNGRREMTERMVEEYNARHIMIAANELVSPSEAQDIAQDIYDRIIAGEDFESLAKEFSDDSSTANLGGDMGWFTPLTYGTRAMQVFQGLNDDEVSEPFQTNAGWHVMQRLATRERDMTEEFIRDQARESIRARKAEEETQTWLRQLRAESFVETRLEGSDQAS
ncbi:MAG: chaperone SurA [Lysobacteraceae bacterium]|nr:MAG: chaperone SurA [Xanthomonadaceae bacterium]